MGLKKAFQGEYVVQDDARQHVFWMQRFLEPELFPHDLIADYFQSVAPPGYPALYRLMARIGRHPLLFNKLLAAVLGPVTTAYCFGLCVQIFPIPATGFIAASQLNQNLWMTFDLVSATPRAFAYPLFLAFLYYLSRRSLLPCLAAIALQGLFYPQTAFISAGVLFLQPWKWEGSRPRLSGNRRDYLFCAAGLGIAMMVILLFAFKSSAYGPTIAAAEARTGLPPQWREGDPPSGSGQTPPGDVDSLP